MTKLSKKNIECWNKFTLLQDSPGIDACYNKGWEDCKKLVIEIINDFSCKYDDHEDERIKIKNAIQKL